MYLAELTKIGISEQAHGFKLSQGHSTNTGGVDYS
jgi:hypothetical protein